MYISKSEISNKSEILTVVNAVKSEKLYNAITIRVYGSHSLSKQKLVKICCDNKNKQLGCRI